MKKQKIIMKGGGNWEVPYSGRNHNHRRKYSLLLEKSAEYFTSLERKFAPTISLFEGPYLP